MTTFLQCPACGHLIPRQSCTPEILATRCPKCFQELLCDFLEAFYPTKDDQERREARRQRVSREKPG